MKSGRQLSPTHQDTTSATAAWSPGEAVATSITSYSATSSHSASAQTAAAAWRLGRLNPNHPEPDPA